MAQKSTINALAIANAVNFKPYADVLPPVPGNLPPEEKKEAYRSNARLILDAYEEEIAKLGMNDNQLQAVVIVTNTFLMQTVGYHYPSFQQRETFDGKIASNLLTALERKANEKAEKALASLSADQLRARLAELEAGK